MMWYFFALIVSVSGAHLGGTLSLKSRSKWSKCLYPLLCTLVFSLAWGILSGLHHWSKVNSNYGYGYLIYFKFLGAVILGLAPALFAGLAGFYARNQSKERYLQVVSLSAFSTYLLELLVVAAAYS